jgi:hypothetical protein
MLQDSITAFTVTEDSSPDGPNTEPLPHSNTMNVPALQSCFLCWRHAERIYQTTPWRNFPSEERHLCRLHWLLALGVHLESVFVREQVNEGYEQDERRQVA